MDKNEEGKSGAAVSCAATGSAFCCDAFSAEVKNSGFDMEVDGTYSITGCCGHCYTHRNMRFCPFCGKTPNVML